jgi:uncharacterized protein YggL (DUF469 family)
MARGTHRMAVNEEHQMIAIGWVDSKAVYFVSTAETYVDVWYKNKINMARFLPY